DRLRGFENAVRESTIPFLVEVHDWDRLPERFHREIERDYVVMSESPAPGMDWGGTGCGDTDRGTLPPGLAATNQDSGRQAAQMTDSPEDEHREAIVAEIAANDRVERALCFNPHATGAGGASPDVNIVLFGRQLTLVDQARLSAAVDEIPVAQSVDLVLYDSIQDRTLRERVWREGVEWYTQPRSTHAAPDNWPMVRLGDHAESCLGKMLDQRKNRGELLPYLGNKNVRWGSFDTRELGRMRFEDHEHDRYGLKYGDLVVCEGGEPGRCAIWKDELPGMKIQKALHRIRAGDQLDNRFLHYWFLLAGRNGALERYFTGTTIKHLTGKAISELQVPLPSLPEQRAIAQILGTLDDKIELNRRMNATLEAMARALFKSWFVDFDPVRAKMEGRDTGLPKKVADLFSDRLVDSELGEIPEGWRAGTLAEVACLNPESWSNRTAPDRILYVDLAKTKGGDINEIQIYSWGEAPSRARRVLRQGDTIVGTVRPGNRSFALIDRDDLTGSTGFAVLRPTDPIEREIVWCTATSHDAIDRLAHLADGGAYPAVNPKVVLDSALALPDSDIRTAFSSLVAPLLNRLQANQRETRTLATFRDTLLPKLVSGELRVQDHERLVKAVASRDITRRMRPTELT
ncbi:MAG: restriction endonuclease subunit S, partial [Gemmatimonadota bacterium]|nr:restriction endonuclease subunit S [Gemmatimonadota bacterium]